MTFLIVNNESSEIIRIFNDAFDDFTPETKGITYYPKNLRTQIDEINEWIYDTVNNGVYKCGFATSQEACKQFITDDNYQISQIILLIIVIII